MFSSQISSENQNVDPSASLVNQPFASIESVNETWKKTENLFQQNFPNFINFLFLYISDKSHKLQVLNALKENLLSPILSFQVLLSNYPENKVVPKTDINDLILFIEKHCKT